MMYEQLEEELEIEKIENEVRTSSCISTSQSTSKSVSNKSKTTSEVSLSTSKTSSRSSVSAPSLKRLKQSSLDVFRSCLGKKKVSTVGNDCSQLDVQISTSETNSSTSKTKNSTSKTNSESDKKKKTKTGKAEEKKRKFRQQWYTDFPWIDHRDGKAFCKICTEAVDAKLLLPTDGQANMSKEAFVINGFSSWSRAVHAFQNHEKTDLHNSAARGLLSFKKNEKQIEKSFSKGNLRDKLRARIALRKIFETVLFFGTEGLPYRASDDENSKFRRLLKLRSYDVSELAEWLNRESVFKWLHHSTIEEVFQMYSDYILNKITEEIRSVKYFSVMMDETCDIARLEQVSVSFRYVTDDFEVKEVFLGFYETKSTTAADLFHIFKDVLLRFNLDVQFLRGQSFDGAANVSGIHNGLRALIQDLEPRAMYIHCVAHRLNLVVQDAFQGIDEIRIFLGVIKELINFVRDSPKRLAFFTDIQTAAAINDDLNPRKLMRFCDTRWCVRVKSLEAILSNYAALCIFFDEIALDKTYNVTAAASASGYVKEMESFKFYFTLNLLIRIFSQIESLNQNFQKEALTVNMSHSEIQTLIKSLQTYRENGYDKFWEETTKNADELGVEPPQLPRVRKMTRRYDQGSNPHTFSSPKEYYGKIFYQVLDVLLSSLRNRYDTEEINILKSIENFVTKKSEKDEDESLMNNILNFYKSDLDGSRLQLHRDIFLDYFKDQNGQNPTSLQEVLDFFASEKCLWNVTSEMKKLCVLVLTIPASSVTCERSFSALKLLKTYLRAVLTAKRLNNIAIMYTFREIFAEELLRQIDHLMDLWIEKNKYRRTVFALSQ